jgi:hypothetical protein
MAKQNSAGKSSKTGAKSRKITLSRDIARDALGKELKSLIPKLDAEGLAFLVKQARVHLYNMQVDELNKAAAAVKSAEVKSQKAAVQKAATRPAGGFKIDKTSSGYYLRYAGSGTIFSMDEITSIVKTIYAGGSELEVCERVYNWFRRERSDVFSLVPIADKFDPLLKAFTAFLKKSFKLKK